MIKALQYLFLLLFPLALNAQSISVKQAEHWYAQKQWERAAEAYSQVVIDNPWNGDHWYRLGWARFRQEKYREAAEAFIQAAPLRAWPANAHYNAACALAKTGEAEAALDQLAAAISTGFYNLQHVREDSDLLSLHTSPRYQYLIKPKAPAMDDRAAGWRTDLAYLSDIMPARHYNLFHSISRAEWQNSIQTLHGKVPQLSDLEMIGELMQLLAAVGDGHTNLFTPLHGPQAFKALPVQFAWFPSGLYVLKVEPGYEEMLGAQVQKFGNRPALEVAQTVSKYTGVDNRQQARMMAEWYLRFIQIHQLERTAGNAESLTLTLTLADGRSKEVTLPAGPVSIASLHGGQDEQQWVSMNHEAKQPLPLWLQHPELPYWSAKVPEDKLLYVSYRQVRDAPHGPSISDLSKQIRQQLQDPQMEAMVLDLRENTGGNGFLNRSLLHAIIQSEHINQPGRLFVIIGYRTFSAAMSMACELERHTEAIFVGEPTGSRPNFYGEHFDFQLPYSGLTASVSARYFQEGFTSDDQRPWIAPHLAAVMTAADYQNNADPAMNAIRAYRQE